MTNDQRQTTNNQFSRSSIGKQTTDEAQIHAEKTLKQSRKVRELACAQLENNQQNDPTIIEAAKTAQEHSETAIQLAQESLQHAQTAASAEGEASHQAFRKAVQSHIEAAKAQNKANQALYQINQQYLAAYQGRSKD
jgi:16S rRNA G1207 methylase RsmC